MRLRAAPKSLLLDLWNTDPTALRSAAEYGSHCRRHHPDEDFSSSPSGGGIVPAGGADEGTNIAFVPLAMPLMCGPGAIATILGMASTIKQSSTELASFVAIVAAILATMFVTYLCLIYAGKLSGKLGPMGIDAITRIVGFFVSAMGVALIFDGVIEVLETHGVTTLH